jgi:hypothetical protein
MADLQENLMTRLKDFRFLRLVPLTALFFAVPVFGQFEVSPDHFDSDGKTVTSGKHTRKNKAGSARLTATPAVHPATSVSVAKVRGKQNAGGGPNSVAAAPNPKLNEVDTSRIDRMPSERGKHEAASKAASVTPSMSQRE